VGSVVCLCRSAPSKTTFTEEERDLGTAEETVSVNPTKSELSRMKEGLTLDSPADEECPNGLLTENQGVERQLSILWRERSHAGIARNISSRNEALPESTKKLRMGRA